MFILQLSPAADMLTALTECCFRVNRYCTYSILGANSKTPEARNMTAAVAACRLAY